MRAEGRVVAVRDDERVESDRLEYYQTRQHVRAGDRVHMTRGPDDLTGEALDYSMEACKARWKTPMSTATSLADAVRWLSRRWRTGAHDRQGYLRNQPIALYHL